MALSCASLVEYFGPHEEYRCGYCKTPDKNFSNGMWSHSLAPEDYQDLIDRGWRRSGKYCYKPMNNKTCCPAYTISSKALDFKISKSQKKVIKRFGKYLEGHDANVKPNKDVSANIDKGVTKTGIDSDMPDDEGVGAENITGLVPKSGKVPQSNIELMDIEQNSSVLSTIPNNATATTTPTNAANIDKRVDLKKDSVEKSDPSATGEAKKPVKKAKELRLERKKQKLIAKGVDPETVIKKPGALPSQQSKSIEELLDFNNETLKRKLVVKTVRVGTSEFKTTFDLEVSLYKSYQTIIHNDEESECDAKQFKRFLCDSPIVADEDEPFGTHHQQYYIDGELIAVGVIDILPKCVSSVYFFYSPKHMFLALGTLGALMEIAYTRSLHRRCPSIKFYYMGFYIHSCVKMRYKGNYFPSYLLCPETYTWHLLDDDLRKKLTEVKYCRLKSTPHETETADVNQVLVLFNHKLMRYSTCIRKRGDDDDKDEVTEYARLVGAKCAERMLLFRS